MNLHQRLTYLSELIITLTSSPVPTQQFQALADHLPTLLPCDYLGLCLLSPDAPGYLVHSLLGEASGFIPYRLFALDEGAVGQMLGRNRTLHVSNLADFPQATADFEQILLRFGMQTAVCLPLRQGEKPLGALFIAASEHGSYGEDEIQIGRLLGAGVSAALENARLYQELIDERRTLAAVLQSSQDAVLMLNEEGVVLLANPAVRQMLHLDTDLLTGQRLEEMVAYPALQQLFAAQRPDLVELAIPNGRFAQASLIPVQSEYGETIGWAALLRDITLFKELEQMKNDFVATVSHDLKNPIHAIVLAADLLGRFGELNEGQQNLQQRIVTTANYMSELVSDLLDLGQIEAGVNLRRDPVDLTLLTADVVGELGVQAGAKGVALTAVLPPDSLVLAGDSGRLKQLLLNLIGNAIKYTPGGGTVTTTLLAEPTCARLTVRDSGIGIPTADLPFIFDKFYRVHTPETKEIKGTGLGLAIVHSIVEAHNGRISVTSTPIQGSTFTVTLPTHLSSNL